MKILIIECDPDNSEVLHEVFKSEGAEVEIANCAALAQNLISSNKYDIVFADHWTLRSEKAIEILSHLKETPLYILSSCAKFKSDFDNISHKKFIPKPYEIKEVLECLQMIH